MGAARVLGCRPIKLIQETNWRNIFLSKLTNTKPPSRSLLPDTDTARSGLDSPAVLGTPVPGLSNAVP